MGWVKLEDKYARNPKMMRAGPLALALDVSGMGYCREHNTDGFIPESALPSLGPVQGAAIKKAVAALVLEQRWFRDDQLAGWWIHDYLEFNPTDEEDKAAASERSARARKAALTRWGKNAPDMPGASSGQCENDAASNAAPMPPPPPLPKEVKDSSSSEPLMRVQGVEEDERLRNCWRALAQLKLQQQKDRGQKVGNERGWLERVAKNAREDQYEEAAGYVATFPDISVSQLVAALMGDKGQLRYLRRAS